MKIKIVFVLTCYALLSACRGGVVTPTQRVLETAPPIQVSPYPYPWTTPTLSALTYPYPSPDATQAVVQLTWEEAEELLLSGQVREVYQLHSLEVTLVTADGQVYRTYEPAIDDVLEVMERCGDLCAEIIFATE